jgi:hypothetical protein
MHRRTWGHCVVSGLMFVSVAAPSPTALAANQEPAGLNLGLTSFFDGFGPTHEGFTYQLYFTFANATSIHDGEGRELQAFRDPRISIFALVNQLSYFLPDTLFGDAVRPGIDFIVPLLLFDTSFGAMGPALTATRVGFGDLTMGPVFQFTPVFVDGHPIFAHRLGLDIIVPVGRYDPSKNLNPSSNFVSLNPNWAATLMLAQGLEVSVRLHYLYNMANLRPTNPPFGLMVERARAGQAVWLNFAASYEIIRSFHLGANGYYFKQLTADDYRLPDGTHIDGVAVHEGKAQVLGIGPGVLWVLSPEHDNQLFANLYFETLVEARAPSTVANLRWLHTF